MFVLLLLEGQVESECEREKASVYMHMESDRNTPFLGADIGEHGHMFVSRLRHHYFRRPVCARVRERDKG